MSRDVARIGGVIGALAAALGLGVGAILDANGLSAGAWVGVAIGAVALGAMGGWLYLSSVSRAITAVGRASNRLAEGDFAERVAEERGVGGDITHLFNSVAGRMQTLFEGLAAEHARLEAVFDASTDAMVALAADTTVRFLNPAAEGLFDVSQVEAIGRPLIESVRDYELDTLVRSAATAGAAEARIITFGAQRLPLRAAATPIPAGGDWSILLLLTDLSDVQRLDQVRRDFIGNVSHELRTPLASIRAMVETLEDSDMQDRETAAEFMKRIRQQVDRLSTLVNELLDLSRIESGAVELRPEMVDPREVAAEAASLLKPRVEVADLTVSLPQQGVGAIEADRSSLLRIVTNLLDNAIKYGGRGTRISVGLVDEGDLIALSVHDEGPGIDAQALPRVFERFYKGESSRAGEGVGLGLAIVKHLTRAHGGTAEVASRPGEGTTFTVRLPKRFVGRRAEDGARPRGGL